MVARSATTMVACECALSSLLCLQQKQQRKYKQGIKEEGEISREIEGIEEYIIWVLFFEQILS